ncbi:MAG TPA: hypothetical protein VEO53_06420 [Candidatus Binatia bacterium]|nr:hypothetical protein [Candidatus Binatia bacterium]
MKTVLWKAFAEQFKQCGRNGTLFIVALLAQVPLLWFTSMLVNALGDFAIPTILAIWLLGLLGGFAGFVHTWRHPVRLGKLPPLSQNDLAAARSKLMKYGDPR